MNEVALEAGNGKCRPNDWLDHHSNDKNTLTWFAHWPKLKYVCQLAHVHHFFFCTSMDATPGDTTNLTWANVGLGLSFILFNAFLSSTLHLGVGNSLVTSAFRCIVQLAIMGLVLQRVFETNNPWAVAGIACTSPPLSTLHTHRTTHDSRPELFGHV